MMPTPAGISEEIEKLERRYATDPEGRFFVPLASAYRRAGESQRAISLLRQGLERHPEYLSAHIVLGEVLADEGEERAAEKEFEFVLSVDPQNLVALRSLGNLAFRRGASDEGRQWYHKLLAVDPMNEEARRALESPERLRPSDDRPHNAGVPPVGEALADGAGHGDPGRVEEEGDDSELHFGEEESSAVITETIAELYARQGFHEQAAEVYRELIRRRGGDALLEERLNRVQRLAHGLPESGAEEHAATSERVFPAEIAASIALDPTDVEGEFRAGDIIDEHLEMGEADLLAWDDPVVGAGGPAESTPLERAGETGVDAEIASPIAVAAVEEVTAGNASEPDQGREGEAWPVEELVAPDESHAHDQLLVDDESRSDDEPFASGESLPVSEDRPEAGTAADFDALLLADSALEGESAPELDVPSLHPINEGSDPFADSFRFGFSRFQEEEAPSAAGRESDDAEPATMVAEWSSGTGTAEPEILAPQKIREFLGKILAWKPAPARADAVARPTPPGEEMHFDSGVLAEVEDLASELSAVPAPRAPGSDVLSEPIEASPAETPTAMLHSASDAPGPGVPAEDDVGAADSAASGSALPEAQRSPGESVFAEEEGDDDLESFQAWLQSLKR